MTAKLNISSTAAVVLASLALTAPTLAQSSRPDAPSKIVRYADLDLSTAAGISTLYSRIKNAAFHVCGRLMPAHNGPAGIENTKCRKTLVDIAVAEACQPALAALHEGRQHKESGSNTLATRQP